MTDASDLRSSARNFLVAVLNCYNGSDVVEKAIDKVTMMSDNWVLGINEGNLKQSEDIITTRGVRIYDDILMGRTFIITNMNNWTHIRTARDVEMTVLKGNFKDIIPLG